MKQNFGKDDLRGIKVLGVMFLIFIAIWLFFRIGLISSLENSLNSISVVYTLGGPKAFAGEQDNKEAFVDSQLYNDTLKVVDTTAGPGDTFWVAVSLTNPSIEVAGFEFLLTYDTSLVKPVYSITDPCYPESSCTSYYMSGHTTARTDSNALPHGWYAWGGRAHNRHLDTLRFSGVTDMLFIWPKPCIPKGGSGPIVRFKFVVTPTATPGEIDSIWFAWWDFSTGNWATVLSDTMGTRQYIPRVKKGIFTVAGAPGNHCPAFTAPVQDTLQVNEGTTLEFDVSATDIDADSIFLTLDQLSPLPPSANYHFLPDTGVGSVTQRFDYTPGYDEAPVVRTATFKARDEHGCVTTKTVRIRVIDTPQDLLIAGSDEGGVPGSTGILLPFMLTNTVDIYGFQFTFRWNADKLDVDSIVRTDAIEGFTMYTNLGDSAGKATVLVFGLAGETIPPGLDTVVYAAFSVHSDAPPEEVPILLSNAREAVNPGYPSKSLGVVHGKFTIDMFGDVNLDRMVDVGDVVSLVAYILGNISFTQRQMSAADINLDLQINVVDLVAMINIILGRWMGPSPPMYPGIMAKVHLDYEDLQPGSSGEVKVMADLEVPVAGAQLKIDYDPDKVSFQAPRLSERSDHFIVEYRDDKMPIK